LLHDFTFRLLFEGLAKALSTDVKHGKLASQQVRGLPIFGKTLIILIKSFPEYLFSSSVADP
jgi:hypothetical protein